MAAATTVALIGAAVAAAGAASAHETARQGRSQVDENIKIQKQENNKAKAELKTKQENEDAIENAKKARTAAAYKQKEGMSAGREGTLIGSFAPPIDGGGKTLLGQ